MLGSVWLQRLLIFLLLAALLAVPAWMALRNWRRHVGRRRWAEAQGWHYAPRGVRVFWQRHCYLTGVTPDGAAWELKPVRRYQQVFYRWETAVTPLPYGIMLILPAHPGSPKHLLGLAEPGVRPYAVDTPGWQDEFRLLVTHQQLGSRYFTDRIAAELLTWPAWPAAGALEEVVWDKGGVIIVARHDTEWALFERLIRLGTLLTAHMVAVQPNGATLSKNGFTDLPAGADAGLSA